MIGVINPQHQSVTTLVLKVLRLKVRHVNQKRVKSHLLAVNIWLKGRHGMAANVFE